MSTTETSLVPLKEEVKEEVSELQVTFNPPLYLERRGWVFSIMRKEKVKEVLCDLEIVSLECSKFRGADIGSVDT